MRACGYSVPVFCDSFLCFDHTLCLGKYTLPPLTAIRETCRFSRFILRNRRLKACNSRLHYSAHREPPDDAIMRCPYHRVNYSRSFYTRLRSGFVEPYTDKRTALQKTVLLRYRVPGNTQGARFLLPRPAFRTCAITGRSHSIALSYAVPRNALSLLRLIRVDGVGNGAACLHPRSPICLYGAHLRMAPRVRP